MEHYFYCYMQYGLGLELEVCTVYIIPYMEINQANFSVCGKI